VSEEEQLGRATHRALWALALYREDVFSTSSTPGRWATAKAAFEAHLVSDAVYSDVLCAAAHASFWHAEHMIAAYLDDEGLGEGEGEDEATTPRTRDNRGTPTSGGRLASIES
jgi:hypothetical protein